MRRSNGINMYCQHVSMPNLPIRRKIVLYCEFIGSKMKTCEHMFHSCFRPSGFVATWRYFSKAMQSTCQINQSHYQILHHEDDTFKCVPVIAVSYTYTTYFIAPHGTLGDAYRLGQVSREFYGLAEFGICTVILQERLHESTKVRINSRLYSQ